MQLAVLIRSQPDGSVHARVPAIPRLEVTAPTREQAVAAVRCAVAETHPSTELVLLDVPEGPPNPWLETAGMFADDPTFDEFVKEMRAAREREDREREYG